MTTLNRRDFLAASGSLLLAFNMPLRDARSAESQADTVLNAWIRIAEDNTAVIYATHPEIGQGIKTALPMILAEELDIHWQQVTVQQSPVDSDTFGRQAAGGSMSVRMAWNPLRQAGAKARTMLLSAAAERWDVSVESCSTSNGQVLHVSTGRKLNYGELAAAAAKVPEPAEVRLKNRADFKLLGKRIGGVDNLAIVSGEPLFGIDQQVANMAFATYTRAPASGGIPTRSNLTEIRTMPGVLDAFVLDAYDAPRGLRAGIAIVADSTWHALKAKRALEVEWDLDSAAQDDWRTLRTTGIELAAEREGVQLHNDGDVDAAFAAADKTISSTYVYPFLPHAPLEPQNCTAWVKGDTAEIWAPSQTPGSGAKLAARACGLDPAKVVIHQTRVGGGFGRRLANDYVVEAVAISQRAGIPVKLQWSREDDFANDYYRPGGFHGLQAAVAKSGELLGWKNHFVTVSADGKSADRWAALGRNVMPQGLIDNYRITQTLQRIGTPTGAWRAPGSNALGFVSNSFLHEISIAAGRDHLEFLLDLMGTSRDLPGSRGSGMNTGRAKDVISRVAERANWGTRMPRGRGQGLAFYYSHGGYFAEIADIEVSENRKVIVHGISVVGDVGPIVNMSMAEHQVVGSVTDGLSTMLGLQVTFSGGRINETNFHQYPVLRMPHAPLVDVEFLQSDNSPSGLGEPALPPVAAAVCNAIYSATGERVRELPLVNSGFRV